MENSRNRSAILLVACLILLLLGAAGAAVGFVSGPRQDAWAWLLISFLIVGGISSGMLAWSAVFRTANARWTPAVNRIAHSASWIMPVTFIVLVVLVWGVRNYMPWVTHPVEEKQWWLNVGFFRARLLAVVGLSFVLNAVMVSLGVAADRIAARGEEIPRKLHYRLNAVSIAAVLGYVLAFTIVAWDLVMSLEPHWISTMFAPYIFITNMYAGMGVMILAAALLRRRPEVARHLGPQQFQDMGNLMLGFSLFSMGLFFAQYLTIWYGNLPFETPWPVLRYYRGFEGVNWPVLSWAIFIVAYALPFILLQSREVKRRAQIVAPIAVLGIVGVAAERYVMVVPALQPGDMWLAGTPGLMAPGLVGLGLLAAALFARGHSPISAADETLPEPEMLEVAQ